MREFTLMAHGAIERERRREDLAAWVIGWLVAPHVKTPPSIEKILGRPTVAQQHEAREWKRAKDQERERKEA